MFRETPENAEECLNIFPNISGDLILQVFTSFSKLLDVQFVLFLSTVLLSSSVFGLLFYDLYLTHSHGMDEDKLL